MAVNTRTAWPRFPVAGIRPGAGIVGAPTAERAGRGGAAVVLRAVESPAHGEGRQRFRGGKERTRPQRAPRQRPTGVGEEMRSSGRDPGCRILMAGLAGPRAPGHRGAGTRHR